MSNPTAVTAPPVEVPLTDETGLNHSWTIWFSRVFKNLTGKYPVVLPSYTVATVPSASTYAYAAIYVSNEAGGAITAFSDGTNWRRTSDRAVIS